MNTEDRLYAQQLVDEAGLGPMVQIRLDQDSVMIRGDLSFRCVHRLSKILDQPYRERTERHRSLYYRALARRNELWLRGDRVLSRLMWSAILHGRLLRACRYYRARTPHDPFDF